MELCGAPLRECLKNDGRAARPFRALKRISGFRLSVRPGIMCSSVQLPDNGPANRNESVATSPAGRPKASSRREFERSLVNALLSGEAGAAKRFLDHTSTTLWSIVAKLEGDGSDGEAAFLHVVTSLEADGGSRLKGF